MANKTGKGGFKKGVAANPGGRPKTIGAVRELARQQTVDAINTLIEVMNDRNESGKTRVVAASLILDRAWGKPESSSTIEVGAAPGQSFPPIVVNIGEKSVDES